VFLGTLFQSKIEKEYIIITCLESILNRVTISMISYKSEKNSLRDLYCLGLGSCRLLIEITQEQKGFRVFVFSIANTELSNSLGIPRSLCVFYH